MEKRIFRENEPDIIIHYSPYHEMVVALHAMYEPGHHLHCEGWIIDRLSIIENENLMIKSDVSLRFLGDVSNGYLNFLSFEQRFQLYDHTIIESIQCLRDVPLVEFYQELLRERYSRKEIQRLLYTNCGHVTCSDEIKRMLKEPAIYRTRCLDFLEEFYGRCFKEWIREHDDQYRRQFNHIYGLLQHTDVDTYLKRLHPRIDVTQDMILFHKYKLFHKNKKDLEYICFVISAFHMPHLLIGIDEQMVEIRIPFHIFEPTHKVPVETVDLFKCLGDETRLRMLKFLVDGPCTTQFAAEQLGISEAAVSKNFKKMLNCGLVYKDRDGHYMQYHVDSQRMQSLSMILQEYVGG